MHCNYKVFNYLFKKTGLLHLFLAALFQLFFYYIKALISIISRHYCCSLSLISLEAESSQYTILKMELLAF